MIAPSMWGRTLRAPNSKIIAYNICSAGFIMRARSLIINSALPYHESVSAENYYEETWTSRQNELWAISETGVSVAGHRGS